MMDMRYAIETSSKIIEAKLLMQKGEIEAFKDFLLANIGKDYTYTEDSVMRPLLQFAASCSEVEEWVRIVMLCMSAHSVDIYAFAEELWQRVDLDDFIEEESDAMRVMLNYVNQLSHENQIRLEEDIQSMNLTETLSLLALILTYTEGCAEKISAAIIQQLVATGFDTRRLALYVSRSLRSTKEKARIYRMPGEIIRIVNLVASGWA